MFKHTLSTAAISLTLLVGILSACNTKDETGTTTTTQEATTTADAPSGSASGIDAVIDDYEELAVEYKDLMAKAKKGDMQAVQQMQGFSQKMMDANKKIQDRIQSEGLTLTAEQQARLKKVGESFNQAAQ
ncbi:hypothetical protein [Spirosoma montaniterrae]|uniref:DUF4168 domain-containing protein n=1 Tax=Spirosoma montaniterrae TaxID=1178516 RepID=A0A1P9WTM8_9BACT|nr:hypothetical protein [Spirosoma montaniterrae]AQG78727.1 hypothetical protein AWR27_04890 [Spirosoma montaniterrae]